MKAFTEHRKPAAIQPRDIEQIFPSLQHSSGIDFSLYQFPTLKRAIQKRMNHLSIKIVTDYVDYLKKNSKEAENISKSMLIRVTQFFRDPEVFKILKKKVFPQIINYPAASCEVFDYGSVNLFHQTVPA